MNGSLVVGLLMMEEALLCPMLMLICTYPRQGSTQAGLPLSLAARYSPLELKIWNALMRLWSHAREDVGGALGGDVDNRIQ
jgi:hypothetical protein